MREFSSIVYTGSYIIKNQVGTHIKDVVSYTPYIHWQNSRFIINAYESTSNSTPNWINFDQQNQLFTVDLSLVKSVLYSSDVIINASIITWTANKTVFNNNPYNFTISYDPSNTTTKDSAVNFIFINDNWEFVKSNITYFLVLGNMSTFMLEFDDKEKDQVILKIIESTGYNTNYDGWISLIMNGINKCKEIWQFYNWY